MILEASVARGLALAPAGTVAHVEGDAVLIAAADAWVRVEQVEVEGRRTQAANVFRDGERLALPDDDLDVNAAS